MADGAKREATWDGGTIRYDRRGRPVFVIERMVAGERFHVSTRTHSPRAALEQLKRFEADPAHYSPTGAGPAADAGPEPLLLSAELAEEFLKYSAAKGNTPKWVRNQRLYIADWAADLANVDLRRATLRDHVVPALDRHETARRFRIELVKALYGWLRKVKHEIKSAQDPTLDLPVPQAQPEKHRRRKIVPVENVRAAREHLPPRIRDALDLILATAWHGTELARFASEGEIVERPPNANRGAWPEGVAGVLAVKQKTGGVERWSVRAEALAAAQRIRGGGAPNERWVNRTLEKACGLAGVPVFTYGPLRHSVLTWARERGAAFDAISHDLAHHKDPRTTRRFYVDVAVPQLLPTEI